MLGRWAIFSRDRRRTPFKIRYTTRRLSRRCCGTLYLRPSGTFVPALNCALYRWVMIKQTRQRSRVAHLAHLRRRLPLRGWSSTAKDKDIAGGGFSLPRALGSCFLERIAHKRAISCPCSIFKQTVACCIPFLHFLRESPPEQQIRTGSGYLAVWARYQRPTRRAVHNGGCVHCQARKDIRCTCFTQIAHSPACAKHRSHFVLQGSTASHGGHWDAAVTGTVSIAVKRTRGVPCRSARASSPSRRAALTGTAPTDHIGIVALAMTRGSASGTARLWNSTKPVSFSLHFRPHCAAMRRSRTRVLLLAQVLDGSCCVLEQTLRGYRGLPEHVAALSGATANNASSGTDRVAFSSTGRNLRGIKQMLERSRQQRRGRQQGYRGTNIYWVCRYNRRCRFVSFLCVLHCA